MKDLERMEKVLVSWGGICRHRTFTKYLYLVGKFRIAG
jgi:hypothetical protein